VRTIIAPLHPEVEAELRALDRKRADIARRYIRRLRLEPDLGVPVDRGLLAEHGCRRIYFDHDDQPDDLFGARRPPARHGNQDLGEGPRWRIVYWTRPALQSGGPARSRPRGRAGDFAPTCRERLRDGATATRTSSQHVPKRKEDEVNAYLVTGPAYHRLMCDDGLPHPAIGLRLSEIGQQQDRVLKMLERGGAIIVHSDDGEHLLGVLTRREPLLGEAMIAAMIDTGNLPPLDELVAMDDRGELP
jgi:hypothetical protein